MENSQGIKNIPTAPFNLNPKRLKRGKVFEPINSAATMQKMYKAIKKSNLC